MRRMGLCLLAALSLFSGSCAKADSMADACEVALKSALISPKGYARIEWTETSEQSSFGQFITWAQQGINSADAAAREALAISLKASSEAIQAGKQIPMRYTGRLTYDAPNPVGVAIRDTVTCGFMSDGASRPTPVTVRLDLRDSLRGGQFR